MDEIEQSLLQAKTNISICHTAEELEKEAIRWFGRNGTINGLLKNIKNIPPEQKKTYGQKINQLKITLQQLLDRQRETIVSATASAEFIDVTLPGRKYPQGSLHLITIAVDEISRIFEKIGFIRVSYPEVEWEYFSFESLNMPKGHPARDDFESIFINFEVVCFISAFISTFIAVNSIDCK